MITRLLKTGALVLTACAVLLPSASAQDFIATGPGSDIPDFNTANNQAGNVTSTITITAEDSLRIGDLAVAINGLTHTWVGDLIATVSHTDLSGETVTGTLFNRVGRGDFPGDGDSSNFDGDYVFASNGASLWEESRQGSSGNGTQSTLDDEFVISPGTYANVNSLGFDNNTNPNVPSSTSLAAIFGGRQSAGQWVIRFTDNDVNDIGSFASTALQFTEATAIPEPGTLGLVTIASIGGFFYVRRKKKQNVSQEQTADQSQA